MNRPSWCVQESHFGSDHSSEGSEDTNFELNQEIKEGEEDELEGLKKSLLLVDFFQPITGHWNVDSL
jgi:U3 small nucleolar ribonucleoprotein component